MPYPKKKKKSTSKRPVVLGKKGTPLPKSALPTRKHRRDPRRMIRPISQSQTLGNESQYVYGKNAVLEILRKDPRRVQKIFTSYSPSSKDARVMQIFELAKETLGKVQTVPIYKLDELLAQEADHQGLVHQGVVALVTAVALQDLEQWLSKVAPLVEETQKGLVIALDEVTDPHNIGAIIRTAEAMGAMGVILPRHRGGSVSPVASKAASGADRTIPLIQVTNLSHALEDLKQAGFWILGADGSEDTASFQQFDYSNLPTVLVMGSEGKGLRPSVKDTCDILGAIPMFGTVESLNVSNATAIMAYEIAMQQNKEE